MKIQKLHIQNYKSLVNLEIIEPNPFTVFAGSNGAGKSNIFEALDFFNLVEKLRQESFPGIFGDLSEVLSFNAIGDTIVFEIYDYENYGHRFSLEIDSNNGYRISEFKSSVIGNPIEYNRLRDIGKIDKHRGILSEYQSRIFVGKARLKRFDFGDDQKINLDASNLEKVLKRLLLDELKREEILNWLDLLVPGFSNIDVVSTSLSGTDSLIIYEKGTNKPFTKNLLSDGTWNILALLTAVYQSDKPQFLCIEEPENGLNPKVQKELVNLFRQKCEDEGHYIWLNTHSQTIVNQLTPKELILVDKVDGETKIKQLTESDTSGLSMDEAWLTNTLGGGIPW